MPLTIFNLAHHAAGTAPDTTPREIELNPPALRLDIAIFDNSALIAFSRDGVFFTTEREFPAGVLSSLDQLVAFIRIRNKTVASNARYDLNAFYDPVEVVGRPFQQLQLR